MEELAPHVGVLFRHIDALLLYASRDDDAAQLLEELVLYLPYFAPKLDALGPHLMLLRPHINRLLPVLPNVAPYADRFAPYVAVSANADVLLFYFGWVFRVPILPKLLLNTPGFPRLCSFCARRLPRWPVRGRTARYVCEWEECDVSAEAEKYEKVRETSFIANAKRYYAAGRLSIDDADAENVQSAVREAMGRKRAAREWSRYRRQEARERERASRSPMELIDSE